MTQNAAEGFNRVADVCANYAVRASRNIETLRERDDVERCFRDLNEIETNRYQENLCCNTTEGKLFRVLGGIISQTKKFTPFGLSESYALHSDIVRANALIHFARQKPESREQFIESLGRDFDRIIWRSRALAAAYRHASKVAGNPEVGRAIAQIGGILNKNAQMPAERFAKADLALAELIKTYKSELNSISVELGDVAWNFLELQKPLSAIPINPLPLWIEYKEHPGAKVINGVWMPQQYAEPLMKDLAAKQAEDMARRYNRQ